MSVKKLWLLFLGLIVGTLWWLSQLTKSNVEPALDHFTPLINESLLDDLHSSYLMQYQPHHFVIRDGFTLPMNRATLPIQYMIRQQWMEDLRNYLYKINPNNSSLINIASSDLNFKDVLLNWLISATVKTTPPLSPILVLSIDKPLHQLLREHSIDSLYIDPKALLNQTVLEAFQTSGRTAFNIIMIMRFVVMRLMNHWGYDVANYDVDAIILKNPNPLFYEKFSNSDLIGSKGIFPQDIKKKFGLTMCAGAFMIKSNSKTEVFWKTLSTLLSMKYKDDQIMLNTALSLMDLKYNTTTKDEIWVGRNPQGFDVTILPEMFICRHECRKEKVHYVWHQYHSGGIKSAKIKRMWYLRNDWVQITENSNATGIKWLTEINNN